MFKFTGDLRRQVQWQGKRWCGLGAGMRVEWGRMGGDAGGGGQCAH